MVTGRGSRIRFSIFYCGCNQSNLSTRILRCKPIHY